MKSASLYLLFFLLLACGKEQEVTNAKISVAGITGSAKYQGGLFLRGESQDGKFKILKSIPANDTIELVLPNGKWDFKVLGWTGGSQNKTFEGEVKCAGKFGVELKGTGIDLGLTATSAKCSELIQRDIDRGDMVGPTGVPVTAVSQIYDTNRNRFYRMAFGSCIGLKGYLDNGYADKIPPELGCGGPSDLMKGSEQSFKVTIIEEELDGRRYSGLTSECRPLTAAYRNYTDINLHPGMNVDFSLFDSTDCSGAPIKVVKFDQGIGAKAIAQDNQGMTVFHTSDSNGNVAPYHTSGNYYLFVGFDGRGCTAASQAKLPFALGDNGKYLVCNAAQFANIAAGPSCLDEQGNDHPTQNCEQDAEYVLGANINFGGANATIPFFSGTIRGNNKTLSNLGAPLFDSISNMSANDKRIADFTIADSNIIESGNENFGLLARVISNYGGGAGGEYEIDRINLLNNTLQITYSGGSDNAIGALFGLVDFETSVPDSGEDLFVRLNYSTTNIESAVNWNTSVGGLVGQIKVDNTNNINMAFERNAVGVPLNPSFNIQLPEGPGNERFDYESLDLSNVVLNCAAYTSCFVGGIVGRTNHIDLRYGNFSFLTATGVAGVGGLVGIVDDQTAAQGQSVKIEDSVAKLNFVPFSASSHVGGVLGRVPDSLGGDSEAVYIQGTVSSLIIGSPAVPASFNINNIGGIVGTYVFDGTPNLFVKHAKAYNSVYSSGGNHGGLIGSFKETAAGSGPGISADENIYSSLALGVMFDEDTNDAASVSTAPANANKGGLVGYADLVRARFNSVQMKLEGHSYVGGAYGVAHSASLEESDILTELRVASSYVGGVSGKYMDTHAMTPLVSYVKVVADILFKNGNYTNLATNLAGYLHGDTDINGTAHANEFLADVAIDGADLNVTSECSGTVGNCSATEIGTSLIVGDGGGNCTPLGSRFSNITGLCQLAFMDRWRTSGTMRDEFGVPVTDNGLPVLLAGSLIEPFEIRSATDWGLIGSDAFLAQKSFEVVGEIDFGGGVIPPIGPAAGTPIDERFKGKIFGAGIIKNGVITGASSHAGLINRTEGGDLGLRDFPLHLSDITINCGTSTYCGLVAYAADSEFFVNAKNITVNSSTSTSAIGGLVGMSSGVTIEESYFSGRIDATSAVNVGGLVGDNESASGETTIKNSLVDLDFIRAGTIAGGIMGRAQIGNGQSSISNSAVWIDINGTSLGNDLQGVSIGGLIGSIGEANFTISTSYVDVSNASVPVSFQVLANDNTSGGQSVTNVGAIGADLNTNWLSSGPWAADYQAMSHQDLQFNLGDFQNEENWLTDSNGRLVPKWYIEGFED